VFLIVGGVWWMNHKPFVEMNASQPVSKNLVQDPLTGLMVNEVHAHQFVFGAMIDEHVDARPQSGIDQAFLVIEAPVEAGIPRLLAFFSQDQSVQKIGPVRSARPYFIDWVNELNALYTHVGGSNEALDKIKNGTTFDLNQFWNDPQFWRSNDRSAPHNVYTSTNLLGAYVKKKQDAGKISKPLYGFWKFKTVLSTDVLPEKFTVSYVNPDYVFSWAYSVEKKTYVRLFEDTPMKTLEGGEIQAQNIAVVITDVSVIDAVGRRAIRTTGEGKAFLFQDGKKMNVTWKKPASGERLRFYGSDGKEVEMNPGKTWIEVIGDESQLTIAS